MGSEMCIRDRDASEQDPDFKGTKFKVAPHVDQTAVYQAVFKRLGTGGCVGIFPEGGSHDRTTLLPLKGKLKLFMFNSSERFPDMIQLVSP